MRELITMWRHTRMVALTAVVAALYAAVLIPFKVVPLNIPGITELRPANALPVLFSFLFGPAAAWGAAMGNTIGDCFGTLGLGTIFGFVGNLFFGYLPYRLWKVLRGGRPVPGSGGESGRLGWWGRFLLVVFTASLACAVLVAWPVELTNLAPFQIVAPFIFLNNLLMAALLAPPLLLWIYPRAERLGLLHGEILEPEDRSPPRAGRTGFSLLLFGLVLALLVGLLYRQGLNPGWAPAVEVATLPFLLLALLALLLV